MEFKLPFFIYRHFFPSPNNSVSILKLMMTIIPEESVTVTVKTLSNIEKTPVSGIYKEGLAAGSDIYTFKKIWTASWWSSTIAIKNVLPSICFSPQNSTLSIIWPLDGAKGRQTVGVLPIVFKLHLSQTHLSQVQVCRDFCFMVFEGIILCHRRLGDNEIGYICC